MSGLNILNVLPWALWLFQELRGPDRVGVLFGNLGTLLDPGTGTLGLAMKAGSCLPRSKQTFLFLLPGSKSLPKGL